MKTNYLKKKLFHIYIIFKMRKTEDQYEWCATWSREKSM